jgi:iron complex transport system substrate-binding protein
MGCHAAGNTGIDVTDDLGRTVHLPRAPQRVVSLLPSLTETVCELGQCDKLVGVDRYSNWPPMVQKLPVLGGGLDPNIESVVAAKPDVVLLATSSKRAVTMLESLGIAVLALEPKSHAQVKHTLGVVAQALGLAPSAAPNLWQHMQQDMALAAQTMPPNAKGMRVYFEVSPAPYAASSASFLGETLAMLGLRNVVGADLGVFPKLNPEWVVRANPDIIMLGDSSLAALQQRPGWQTMRAMQGQQWCAFDREQSDILVRAGPRMAQAAGLVAQCLVRLQAKAIKTQQPSTQTHP